MIIPGVAAAAVWCPACGKMQVKSLSLFQFAGFRKIDVTCRCGAPLMSIETRDRRIFYLQIYCTICDTWHIFTARRQEIWSGGRSEFLCDDSGLEVAFIGPRRQVNRYRVVQKKSWGEMAEDLGFGNYFTHADIMCGVLECLYEIASRGRLYCQCGNNDIEVKIFSDHLELCCGECGSRAMLRAEGREDLIALQQVREIRLPASRTHFKK